MTDIANDTSPDSIADCVLNAFNSLPQKFKPRILDDGRHEWVPLAGIVLSRDSSPRMSQVISPAHSDARREGLGTDLPPPMMCAALATGMKCLPQSKIALANGNILHDWHAEVLAIRAFNRWLIDECTDLAHDGFSSESAWVRWRLEGPEYGGLLDLWNRDLDNCYWNCQPWALRDDVRIHMYCSEAPCGDASMEVTMASQVDPTPWASQPATAEDGTVTEMLGRGNFDHLGIVRRKPGRSDAPTTLSKSCSDKLALKQVTGLLSGLNALLIHPENTYISQLVLPESQFVSTAVARSFSESGRMSSLAGRKWSDSGFAFKPFAVAATTREFAFSKRIAGNELPVPSNLSALRTPYRQEVLVNGVLQGRKQFDCKGASCVSRRMIWKSLLDLALLAGLPAVAAALKKRTYADVKAAEPLVKRAEVKRNVRESALQNWIKNDGDEYWSLEEQ